MPSHIVASMVRNFWRDEDAAVTVDWVVLTASLVTVAIAIVLTIQTSLESGAAAITTDVNSTISTLLP